MEFPLFKNFIIADLLQAISSAFAALTLFIIIYAKFVSKVTVFKGHKVETTLKTQVVLSFGWLAVEHFFNQESGQTRKPENFQD